MALTLITGRANAGKTGTVYGTLERAVAEGGAGVLLLPTHPDVVRAERELASRVPRGLRISTLGAYLSLLWPSCADPRRIATHAQRHSLMRQALAETGHSEELRSAAAATRMAVVASACAGSGWPSGGEEGSTVVRAAIDGYREALEDAGLVEPEEALRIAGARATGLSDTTLAAHRFVGLSPGQLTFLESAARRAAAVIVSLTFDDSVAETRALGDIVRRPGIARIESSHGIVSADEDAGAVRPLAVLEEGMTSRSTSEGVRARGLRFVEVPGPRAEAGGLVDVVSGLLDRDVPAERIAVVYRDPGERIESAARGLRAAGIACDVDAPVAAARTPLGRALSRLGAWARGGDRADLVSFLRSPYSGMPVSAADRLEAGWRRRRVIDRARLGSDVEATSRAPSDLLRLASGLAPADPPSAATDAARLTSIMTTHAYGRGAPTLGAEGRLDAALRSTFVGAIEEVAALGEPFDAFAPLESMRVPPDEVETEGRVQVLPADRARSRRFDAVVLAGLERGAFPRDADAPAEDALARRLGAEPTRRHGAEHERLLFYQVVTRARRELVLLRRSEGADGDPLSPSRFWDEAMEAFGGEVEALGGRGVDDDRPGPDDRGGWDSGTGPRPLRTDLSEEVRARLAARDVFSAGELESYSVCPYAWFFERVLRPRALDESLDAAQAGGLVHEVLRRVYERLPERVGAARVDERTLPAALGLLDEVYADASTRAADPHDLEEAERLHAVRRWARTSLHRDAVSTPGLEPWLLEWSFGMEDGDEPEDMGGFMLRGRIDRIDRGRAGLLVIDYKTSGGPRFERFARDGLLQLPLYGAVARRRLGRELVGGVYRDVASDAVRGFYLSGAVSEVGPGSGRSALDAPTLETVLDDALRRAHEAVEGIRAGRIEPPEEPPDRCRYCVAAPVCERSRS